MTTRFPILRRGLLAALSLWLPAAVAYADAGTVSASDTQEIRALFLRQAAAATAHDIVAFEGVLATPPAGQPDPVTFVARAYQFWGKPALVDHFKETFKGVWKFEPDAERIRIVPLSADVAELYAPTQVTSGASEASAKTVPFLVYEVAVRTAAGWRIASIVPVSAQ
ncbi:YybH family protein [Cupriavidus sp. 30B13]|uniref:YybH family protein n=1 Tax=Cupriavidus sp. 30B13 TaxID=3384241 RepID=UPI003B910BD5